MFPLIEVKYSAGQEIRMRLKKSLDCDDGMLSA